MTPLTMTITLNGSPKTLAAATTLADLVESLGMKPDRVAMEHNHSLAPRSTWAQVCLAEGDQVELVHFVGGGS